MKKHTFLVLGILFFSIAGFSQQEIKLSDILKPGDSGIAEKQGILLAEYLVGPHKAVLSGNSHGSAVPVLSKEEQDKSGGRGSFDKLAVSFSGKFHSPNMAEPIIFENKTADELVLIEFPIFPIYPEQPYALFMDLTIKASSKPINMTLSDDAGIYQAVLNVTLFKI